MRRRALALSPAARGPSSVVLVQRRRGGRRSSRASLRQRQFLLQFDCADLLSVTRPASLKQFCVGELSDHDRIEAGVANESARDANRLRIIAGNGHCKSRGGPVANIL